MSRLSFYRYLLKIAEAASLRSTCCLRSVGAVVADRDRIVRGTGYNGPPRGLPHCSTDHPCDPQVTGLVAPYTYDTCLAAHAEANALLIAGRVRDGIIAVTVQPCRNCAILIVNAGIRQVVYGEEHRLWDADISWPAARIFSQAGVKAILL